MKKTLIFITASLLIIVGFILMSGPCSTTEAFCPEIFSIRRIVIAPVLCLAGYLLMMVGIMWRK
ncbi:MAG: DUF3098 domain-containing protein [Prevotella sp.]|nr:DUF3098 domain-containing protein [Prevotella sp.]